jgi:hypothetical protein
MRLQGLIFKVGLDFAETKFRAFEPLNHHARGTPDSSGSERRAGRFCRMNPAFPSIGSWKRDLSR